MDSRKIAQEIYNIDHNDALYAPVKEALDVIDECLDIHGSVRAVKGTTQGLTIPQTEPYITEL